MFCSHSMCANLHGCWIGTIEILHLLCAPATIPMRRRGLKVNRTTIAGASTRWKPSSRLAVPSRRRRVTARPSPPRVLECAEGIEREIER